MKKLLRVPDRTGDQEFHFDDAKADEAKALAEEAFDKARKVGSAVVTVEPGQEGGVTVHNFKDLSEENVVIRPLVAG